MVKLRDLNQEVIRVCDESARIEKPLLQFGHARRNRTWINIIIAVMTV